MANEAMTGIKSDKTEAGIAVLVLVFVLCGLVGMFVLEVTDPGFSLRQLASRDFWIPFLFATGFLIVTGTLLMLAHDYTFRGLHWLGARFYAVAPAPLGKATRWAARMAKLIYGAILLCGVTAFGVNLALWRVPHPGFADPMMRNPFFWATWFGLMTLIMMAGVIMAALFRFVVVLGVTAHRRLWKPRDKT